MNIGFPKCGTATINRAMKETGFISVHSRVYYEEPKFNMFYVSSIIYKAYNEGKDPFIYFTKVESITQPDIIKSLRAYEKKYVLVLWPQLDMDILKKIREYNPDTLLLLNTRDIKDHILSINNHSNGGYRQDLINCELPFLPQGIGEKDEEIEEWIFGHYERCRKLFHNDSMFLEVDIKDPEAKEKISEKLGVELKWWGVENKTVNSGNK